MRYRPHSISRDRHASEARARLLPRRWLTASVVWLTAFTFVSIAAGQQLSSMAIPTLRSVSAPGGPDTIERLLDANQFDEAVRGIRSLLRAHPERMAPLFHMLADRADQFDGVDDSSRPAIRNEIVSLATTQLTGLPREAAATAALDIGIFDSSFSPGDVFGRDIAQRALRASIVREYPGTQAALVAEVDLLEMDRLQDSNVTLQIFESYAARHPGTVAAAKALFLKASALGADTFRSVDPTDHILDILSIVARLERGQYPPCEWVSRAPELVLTTGGASAVTPANAARLLAAYEDFVRTHFDIVNHDSADSGVGYLIGARMAGLFALTGEGWTGVERLFALLDQNAQQRVPARYLHATIEIRRAREDASVDRVATLVHARELTHRAQVEEAIALADAGRVDADLNGALRLLDAVLADE